MLNGGLLSPGASARERIEALVDPWRVSDCRRSVPKRSTCKRAHHAAVLNIACRSTRRLISPCEARYPRGRPPAKLSPAPVGSRTSSIGVARKRGRDDRRRRIRDRGKDGCAVLTVLDDQRARTHLHSTLRAARGRLLSPASVFGFAVVDQQNVDALQSFCPGSRGAR